MIRRWLMQVKIVNWIFVSTVILAIIFLTFYAHQLHLPDAHISIREVHVVNNESIEIPKDNARYVSTDLPDVWRKKNRTSSNVWYKAPIVLNVPPDRLWGIYLPLVSQNAAVYLNGELLGTGGYFSPNISNNENRPLYFSIPNGLLRPGRNIFHIRVQSASMRSGILHSVLLGPDEYLHSSYNFRYFVKYSLSQFIIILLGVTSLFTGSLWILRRHETVFGWFSMSIFIWMIHSLFLVIIDVPLPARVWDWGRFVSMLWFSISAAIFVRRFLSIQKSRIESYLYCWGVTASIVLYVSGTYMYAIGVWCTNVSALLIGLYPILLLIREYIRMPHFDYMALAISGIIIAIFGFHDILVISHMIDALDGRFIIYSAPLAVFIFVTILLRRFVFVMRETESMNIELEDIVEKKHEEIKKNYNELRRFEHKQIIADERERIMRDMHDGMGGHLVNSLAIVESETLDGNLLKSVILSALDDMRLVIDSMDDVGGDLLHVLGMLRDRLEPRLHQSGIKLVWQAKTIPILRKMGPKITLQIMRIFQEAITNAIKHSTADTITLKTDVIFKDNTENISILLCDNGNGFNHEGKNTSGRGLHNMRKRAEIINGEVSFSRKSGKTCVELLLPLEYYLSTNTEISPIHGMS